MEWWRCFLVFERCLDKSKLGDGSVAEITINAFDEPRCIMLELQSSNRCHPQMESAVPPFATWECETIGLADLRLLGADNRWPIGQ